MRQIDAADAAHLLFALFLLFQQLLLPRDIAAVALGQNVLAERFDRFTGDDLAADGRLHRDFKQLAGDVVLQLFDNSSGSRIGVVGVDDERQRVHRFAVEQDVELDELRFPVAEQLIVERRIPLGARFQRIEKVVDDFVERQLIVDFIPVGVEQRQALVDAE